ncbi:hypothetical protein D3C80_1833410 [compost metagenome]
MRLQLKISMVAEGSRHLPAFRVKPASSSASFNPLKASHSSASSFPDRQMSSMYTVAVMVEGRPRMYDPTADVVRTKVARMGD